MEVFAHAIDGQEEEYWEAIGEHLRLVAQGDGHFLPGATGFAEALGAAEMGRLAGLWHDLGKYHPDFQRRLRGERIQVEHSGAGALLAHEKHGRAGIALAFAIAGHHAGLANLKANAAVPNVSRLPLKERLKNNKEILACIRDLAPAWLVDQAPPTLPRWLEEVENNTQQDGFRSYEFFTRMLFACLVDADRLATSRFFALAEGRRPDYELLRYDDLAALRDRLDAYVDGLSTGCSAFPINELRATVLDACRLASEQSPGLFSLTVPTGGGKTLAAMSFALRHALLHGIRRVIVVIPFTSIIEQNADVYRKALAVDGKPDNRNILEHHSGIDEQRSEEVNRPAEIRLRLAAENWDAPIVVTTSVQFFESLFSDHPSRCRKLHRIANSVIILDEVQTLPPGLLIPILDGIRELSSHYGVTVVFSTATPPALARRESFPKGLAGVRRIIDDPVTLADSPAARRVQMEWRVGQVTTYERLAAEMAGRKQVLAVVHRRADARLLAEQLPPDGRFHLSALMCPAHRLKKIQQITQALRNGEACRLAATQLIEAGVDLDFPVVYRALAGLDSLAQAAGRCDREGKLTQSAGHPAGMFIVFRAETDPPGDTLRKAMESTETLLGQVGDPALPHDLDPFNPAHCELFFRELYGKQDLDGHQIQRERAGFNFANVAAAFQMIQDDWSRPVVVPWGDGANRTKAFRNDPGRRAARALQPFVVQVSLQHLEQLRNAGAVEPWEDTNLYLPTDLFGERYSEEVGLAVADGPIDPELLMV